MSRTNDTLDRVFLDVVGETSDKDLCKKFIKKGEKRDKSKLLKDFESKYSEEVENSRGLLNTLANIEVVILQMRVIENIDIKDIKLSITRGYIYARCPFFRRDNVSKNISTLVGNTTTHGENIELLYKDNEFMKMTKEKIKIIMKKEVDNNIKNYGL